MYKYLKTYVQCSSILDADRLVNRILFANCFDNLLMILSHFLKEKC